MLCKICGRTEWAWHFEVQRPANQPPESERGSIAGSLSWLPLNTDEADAEKWNGSLVFRGKIYRHRRSAVTFA